MSSARKDDIVGRVKQAAGALGGDEELERAGRRDRAGAKVKDGTDKASHVVGRLVDKAKDAFPD